MSSIPLRFLYPKDIKEAIAMQKEIAKKVIIQDILVYPQTIAGMDVSNTPFDPESRIFGSILVLSYPDLEILETKVQQTLQTFPYIPGLLGFREAPVLVQAFEQLQKKPDLIFVDGHGISHPRGLGIASHIGVLLDIPTIGVAKSILVGTPEGILGEDVGSYVPLKWKGKEIGRLLRTKKRCAPLIISVGHKVTLQEAIKWVLSCLKKWRLPEPTRKAHLAANAYRKEYELGLSSLKKPQVRIWKKLS